MSDKIGAFLSDLSELSNKHGVTIHSCGCCHSPWLSENNARGSYTIDNGGDDMRWVISS